MKDQYTGRNLTDRSGNIVCASKEEVISSLLAILFEACGAGQHPLVTPCSNCSNRDPRKIDKSDGYWPPSLNGKCILQIQNYRAYQLLAADTIQ